VQKYNVEKYIKLRTQALEASWDSEAAKWVVTLKNIETGQVFQDSADALLTGIGVLNDWKWPDIPGLHDFQGKLLHSADWDSSYDYKVSQRGDKGLLFIPADFNCRISELR
jgi:cation diffusion facilitator CzcD-associated flavoprotein CzcO